jgi:hypothetical protein
LGQKGNASEAVNFCKSQRSLDEPKKIGWDGFIVLFGTKREYFRSGQCLYIAEVVWMSQKRSVGIDL